MDSRAKWLWPVGAGILASIKWSVFPVLGTLSLFSLMFLGLRHKIGVLVFGLVIITLALIYYDHLEIYIGYTLRLFENASPPQGISLQTVLPKTLAKSLQLVTFAFMVITFFFSVSRQKWPIAAMATIFPFTMVMAIQGMCYATLSYEYRVVSLLGFIVPLFVWIRSDFEISQKMKLATSLVFAAFILLAFRPIHFFLYREPSWIADQMVIMYLGFSAIFVLIYLFILNNLKRNSTEFKTKVINSAESSK